MSSSLVSTPEPAASVPEIVGDGIGPCFSGHPVRFSLLTAPPFQFAAYYAPDGAMTVARRRLEENVWSTAVLPETVGWDSHNGIVLARDAAGFLHLSGNMHASPLVYFRTRLSDDIASFERIPLMVGEREAAVTYPEFFTGPSGVLCFNYRDGSSGKGDQVYNRYDVRAQRWERLASGAIVSGLGVCNAYLDGPHRGPDGLFHLCWVWRDNPDAATNHDVCYARSRDLVHWETSAGEALSLPITPRSAEVVDPVPAGVGLMNGNVLLGFDGEGRPVIAYHKLDAGGRTQLYNARLEKAGWRIHETSHWNHLWMPQGWGTIIFQIRISPVWTSRDGTLLQSYFHAKEGAGLWRLDPETLRPLETTPSLASRLSAALFPVSPGMTRHWITDQRFPSGTDPFALTWESLPENRDKPQAELSPTSRLQIVRQGNEWAGVVNVT